MICARCGRAEAFVGEHETTAGCPVHFDFTVNLPPAPPGGIDTGEIHRAPLLKEIALLRAVVEQARAMRPMIVPTPGTYGLTINYFDQALAAYDAWNQPFGDLEAGG